MMHEVFEYIVVGAYVIICYQFGHAAWIAKKHKSKAAHGIFYLSAIFILCAMTRHKAFMAEIPDWLYNSLHVGLIAVCVGFIATNRAGAIMRAVDED